MVKGQLYSVSDSNSPISSGMFLCKGSEKVD